MISAQITLWNQSGSSVVRGNLIVVPVGEALLYLQPVYLQSTSSAFPEFQKIVVASPTTIVWGDTLAEALTLLLAEQAEAPGPSPARPRTVTRTVRDARAVRDARPVGDARPATPPPDDRAARPTWTGSSTTRTPTSRPRRRRSGPATSRRTGRRWTRSRTRSRALGGLTGASPQP